MGREQVRGRGERASHRKSKRGRVRESKKKEESKIEQRRERKKWGEREEEKEEGKEKEKERGGLTRRPLDIDELVIHTTINRSRHRPVLCCTNFLAAG